VKPSPGVERWPSEHFTRSELACRHCGVAIVRPRLLALLERIRAKSGKPLVLRSAYRCPVHNAVVGGAANSQHMYGAAADLAQGVVSVKEAHALGAIGVGSQGGWAVHVDVRDGAGADWSYDVAS
jgi:zinc D-Ala-D-Ala carboxypeptidase